MRFLQAQSFNSSGTEILSGCFIAELCGSLTILSRGLFCCFSSTSAWIEFSKAVATRACGLIVD